MFGTKLNHTIKGFTKNHTGYKKIKSILFFFY